MTRIWKALALSAAVAGLLLAAVPAAAQPAAGGARVPWSEVGPGWVLDEYTVVFPKAEPAELYLFSPQGTRYLLASWPDSRTAPQLVAWSPDHKRALFTFGEVPRTEQLTLATGKATTFNLPRGFVAIGYTAPRGTDIVGYTSAGCPAACAYTFHRFSQDGTLAGSLGTYPGLGQEILYSASGTELAGGGGRGLELASSSGTLIRQLPVPGMVAKSCSPVRWWNSGTILAECFPPPGPFVTGGQLWLVPASGAPPAALTPPAQPASGDDDAWQLSGGLYVSYHQEHSGGICDQVKSSGGCQPVSVPGLADSADPQALTAIGSWLLVVAPPSGFAPSSGQLLWFDPATHAERWLMRVPANVYGDSAAIPF